MSEPSPSLRLEAIEKAYGEGRAAVKVLHGIDLEIGRGELTAIMGPSGSGKSTLLNLLGLLDRPTGGELFVEGTPTADLDDAGRTALRGATLGFVFQFHHLLPALTAEENVAMPLAVLEGRLRSGALEKARAALERLGVGELARRRPQEMSGGQRQRVAVARALVREPRVVLADEPTGNLDTETSAEVFREIRRLNDELGITFLIVTHDPDLAAGCERVVTLVDGRIVSDVRPAAS